MADTRGGQDLSKANWQPLKDQSGKPVHDKGGKPVLVRFGKDGSITAQTNGKGADKAPTRPTSVKVDTLLGSTSARPVDAPGETQGYDPAAMAGAPLPAIGSDGQSAAGITPVGSAGQSAAGITPAGRSGQIAAGIEPFRPNAKPPIDLGMLPEVTITGSATEGPEGEAESPTLDSESENAGMAKAMGEFVKRMEDAVHKMKKASKPGRQ